MPPDSRFSLPPSQLRQRGPKGRLAQPEETLVRVPSSLAETTDGTLRARLRPAEADILGLSDQAGHRVRRVRASGARASGARTMSAGWVAEVDQGPTGSRP